MTRQADSADEASNSIGFVLPIASGLLGLSLCIFSVLGFSQLRTATLNGTGSLKELPIARFFLDLFTPSTGTINIAKVASNAQFAILSTCLVGACLIFLAIIILVKAKR